MTHTAQAHSSRTDRPADLTTEETRAYVSGYARGIKAYGRKYGFPTGDGTLSAADLSAMTRAHEEQQHPTAHRAGIAGLTKYRKTYGIAAPVMVKVATTKRKAPAVKAPAVKVAAVLSVVPAHGITKTELSSLAIDPTKPVRVERVKPATKRKAAAVKTPSVATVATTAPMTRAARKASNRELAATMRAAGITITAETWATAKAGTPVSV